jgi:hypothetical protein
MPLMCSDVRLEQIHPSFSIKSSLSSSLNWVPRPIYKGKIRLQWQPSAGQNTSYHAGSEHSACHIVLRGAHAIYSLLVDMLWIED